VFQDGVLAVVLLVKADPDGLLHIGHFVDFRQPSLAQIPFSVPKRMARGISCYASKCSNSALMSGID